VCVYVCVPVHVFVGACVCAWCAWYYGNTIGFCFMDPSN
jgi:hypothetical protein